MYPKCPKCNKEMVASESKEYDYQCLNCDEDFYACEVLDTLDRGWDY
jgi:tRNA(Ile2) C34 agmatinyltransferase TiaS